ncbi:MAG: hypothetical protein OES69_17840, partial [Myxococcales bacterium]|nr:hypothetical protein [Myxococcales bacterium]
LRPHQRHVPRRIRHPSRRESPGHRKGLLPRPPHRSPPPSGTDAASALNIAFQIALDPQAALIFSFITALTD